MILIFKATLYLRKNLVWNVIDKDKGMCGPIVGLGDASKPIEQVFKAKQVFKGEHFCILGTQLSNMHWKLQEKLSPLLACSVPDLQFDLLSIDLDGLDHKVDAYGRSLPRREHALKVTFIFFSREEWITNKQRYKETKRRRAHLSERHQQQQAANKRRI